MIIHLFWNLSNYIPHSVFAYKVLSTNKKIIYMSNVIYYSNYCENSKKIIKALNSQKDIHWLCIDKRAKEGNNTYILLENGQKVLLPPNINRIPALLSLTTYQTTFGNDILGVFSSKIEKQTAVATQGNMEPMAFSFGSGGGGAGVVSDCYSSWDLNTEQLAATGNGGIMQMHNYVGVNHTDSISSSLSESDYKKGSRSGNTDAEMERLMAQRAADLSSLNSR